MRQHLYILFAILLLWDACLNAQTPYDSFSPETTRPMVEREALYPEIEGQPEPQSLDTIPCVAVVDLQRRAVLLVDINNETILGATPLTDELQKWLSVDPLVDKYIFNSPYMYCNGNPIKYVDPNGMYYDEGNEQRAQQIEKMLQAKIQEVTQMRDSYARDSKEYNNCNNRLEELNLSLQDFSDMRYDPNYEYRFEQGTESDTKCTSVNERCHPVVRIISSEDALAIHEGRHGGQNARREMILYSYGTVLKYGVSSEQSAYRAQLAYAGKLVLPLQVYYSNGLYDVKNTTLTTVNDVTKSVVNSIVEIIDKFVYPPQNYNSILWKLF